MTTGKRWRHRAGDTLLAIGVEIVSVETDDATLARDTYYRIRTLCCGRIKRVSHKRLTHLIGKKAKRCRDCYTKRAFTAGTAAGDTSVDIGEISRQSSIPPGRFRWEDRMWRQWT